MNFLTQIEESSKSIEVGSMMFVFEEHNEADVYAHKLAELKNDPSVFDIEEKENWDQAGILTILLTYKRRT